MFFRFLPLSALLPVSLLCCFSASLLTCFFFILFSASIVFLFCFPVFFCFLLLCLSTSLLSRVFIFLSFCLCFSRKVAPSCLSSLLALQVCLGRWLRACLEHLSFRFRSQQQKAVGFQSLEAGGGIPIFPSLPIGRSRVPGTLEPWNLGTLEPCLPLVSHLSLTCLSLVSHLSPTCPSLVFHLSRTCLPLVFHLSTQSGICQLSHVAQNIPNRRFQLQNNANSMQNRRFHLQNAATRMEKARAARNQIPASLGRITL